MVIVIDGYNLLKQVFPGRRGHLEEKRQQFIHQLGLYRACKGQKIIVVFDGGDFSHATREICSGVIVVFSGQKRSADEWITDYVVCNKHKELMLVSLDRELIKQCQRFGCDAVEVFDFYQLLQQTLLEDAPCNLSTKKSSEVKKYEHDDDNQPFVVESEGLDSLMMQADVSRCEKDDGYNEHQQKQRKGKRCSKDERRILKKIKKL